LTRVEFVKLPRPEKALLLCELAQEFYQQGRKVLVLVQDNNQGLTLDNFMWVWNKGSFVPHAHDNGAVDCHDEPVVIASTEKNCNGAQVLILGAACSTDFMRHFEHVVDFAEVHDDASREASRTRFAHYKESGLGPYLRQ